MERERERIYYFKGTINYTLIFNLNKYSIIVFKIFREKKKRRLLKPPNLTAKQRKNSRLTLFGKGHFRHLARSPFTKQGTAATEQQ